MSSLETQRRFQLGLVEAMGLEHEVLDRPGTSVAATDDRAGSGMVACYQIGRHTVLWCDPAVVADIEDLADGGRSLSDADWRAWAADRGLEVLGQAVMKTLVAPLRPVPTPAEATRLRFDWAVAEHRSLVRDLIDVSDEDDLDDAEIEMDDLDDVAVGLLDSEGAVGAYASMRPWEHGGPFGDIGVLTRRDLRGASWGSAVVSALIEHAMPSGWEPLYRCDPENPGSDRLSAGLGFVVANSLTAVQVGTRTDGD